MARRIDTLPPLILASASPRRSDLLSRLTEEFTVIPSDAQEIHNEQLTAREICQINAYRKARAVAKQHPDHLILAADTLVALGTKLFDKPSDIDEAKQMLLELQGRTHEVVTGVCLMRLRSHVCKTWTESTWVTFKELDESVIREYVAKVPTLDKAGAYGIQDHGEMLVESIEGSFDNVVGLPTESLERALVQFAGHEEPAFA